MTITIKDPEGIAGMRVAGRLAAQLLDYLTPLVQPGITTNELDRLAELHTTQVLGAISAPLNYAPGGHNPYRNRSALRSTTKSATAFPMTNP